MCVIGEVNVFKCDVLFLFLLDFVKVGEFLGFFWEVFDGEILMFMSCVFEFVVENWFFDGVVMVVWVGNGNKNVKFNGEIRRWFMIIKFCDWWFFIGMLCYGDWELWENCEEVCVLVVDFFNVCLWFLEWKRKGE